MAEHILLVEQQGDWREGFPAGRVVTAREYLGSSEFASRRPLRVINLCRSYRYLSLGYYCSLLAEARGHRVVPTVRTIQDLGRRSVYGLVTGDLDALVQKTLNRRRRTGLEPTAYEVSIYFGRCEAEELKEVARHVFDEFRCPLLKVEFRKKERWRIEGVKPISIHQLPPDQGAPFQEGLIRFMSRRWSMPRSRAAFRYDLAILLDPREEFAPSNAKAIARFARVGRGMGINVELIGKRDHSRLGEFDALFLRETTAINHHTYQFARKADSDGLVVIDDPDSILRCTNKVYLAELLRTHRVPTPRTVIARRESLADVEGTLSYPMVLKIPDGSFSRGVFKVDDREEMLKVAERILNDSDLILAQEFLYTEFDWRVGILGRKPLYVCKYYMSKKHWQILDRTRNGKLKEGRGESLKVQGAPPEVVKTALRAANLIGDGLYGVDLKLVDGRPLVIEVNDNPNIDAGVEDRALGDDLYKAVLGHFIERIEARRASGARRSEGASNGGGG